jgi:hypothetical protein
MLDTADNRSKWEKEPIAHGWDDELISLNMSDWKMMLFDQFDILFFEMREK